jgi:hypothetical protein
MGTSLPLIIRCPQCPGLQQGTSLARERLTEMLQSGEDITVMGSQCGHVWSLSTLEKENLRKFLAEDAL